MFCRASSVVTGTFGVLLHVILQVQACVQYVRIYRRGELSFICQCNGIGWLNFRLHGRGLLRAPAASLRSLVEVYTERYPAQCEEHARFNHRRVCWAQEHQGCPEPFLHALNYSQVAGLISGMVTVGMFIDRIGRKWGSVTTASIMFVGAGLPSH